MPCTHYKVWHLLWDNNIYIIFKSNWLLMCLQADHAKAKPAERLIQGTLNFYSINPPHNWSATVAWLERHLRQLPQTITLSQFDLSSWGKARRVEPCEFRDERLWAAYSSAAAFKPSHLTAPEAPTHDQTFTQHHGFSFSWLVTHKDMRARWLEKKALEVKQQFLLRSQGIHKKWRTLVWVNVFLVVVVNFRINKFESLV